MNEGSEHLEDEPVDAATLLVLAAGHVRDRVQSNPAATLAVAFGVGYVLGRGLPDVVVRLGLAAAVRMLGEEAVRHATNRGSSIDPMSARQ